MSQDQALQYLQQGIAAAKAKRNDEARSLLQNAVRLNPENETAWLWLSSVAKDNKERIFCLRQLLQLNPENEMARKGLRALGVSSESQSAATSQGGVPFPSAEKIARASVAIHGIIDQLQSPEDPYANIKWVNKKRNRTGETAATIFTWSIRIIPVLILVGIIGGGAWFVTTYPDAIALAPTWTPSFTPTNTPTPTPGFTPTPSPTPRRTPTPSPTVDPVIPQGDLFAGLTSTPVYPRIGSRPLLEAAVMIDQGKEATALPALASERELTEFTFDANPYYYEAIALANMGETEQAETVLQEAVTRLEESGEDSALIHAGLAYVLSKSGSYEQSDEEAALALEADRMLVMPHRITAKNAIDTRRYEEADKALERGLSAHPSNVYLWLLKAELELQRGEPAAAQQAAFMALYIDPTAEDAYLVQARADVASGDYGLAVLHLQNYLFIYPGSIQGWTLLGTVRELEGNPDLALAAYSQALNTEDSLEIQIPAYLARAKLYTQRRRYEEAYEDYSAVLSLNSARTEIREARASVAYRAGLYEEALDDAAAALAEARNNNSMRLLQARAILESANPSNEEAYSEALDEALAILEGSFPMRLTGNERAMAYEYRARVVLAQEDTAGALNDINEALAISESGSRHYWRGRILEAQGELAAARQEYEWVNTWGSLYGYPFLPDVVARLDGLDAENS